MVVLVWPFFSDHLFFVSESMLGSYALIFVVLVLAYKMMLGINGIEISIIDSIFQIKMNFKITQKIEP